MRLTKAHVTDFQSIRDSKEFELGDITCLVGKNEAGKTALLQAMYRVFPIVPNDNRFNVTDDYPRRDVADYKHDIDEEERDHSVVTKLTYALDEDDVAAIEAVVGPDALASRQMNISKAYDSETITFRLELNEKAALQHILAKFTVTDDIRDSLSKCSTVEAAKEVVGPAEQTEAIKNITKWLDALQKAGSATTYIFRNVLSARIPKFLYFDEYYQMQGCDNIEALKKRKQDKALRKSDHPLLGLIRKARLDLDGLLSPGRTRELKNSLEGAGNYLTKSIVKYWSQNKHLQMRFDVRPAQPQDPEGMRSGTNIWSEVYDTRHMVTTELGSRSRGFVWFFSFLAWYGDLQSDRANVILLLDEPGLSLHGKAQGDLLRYFEEELAPNHQLIYTTHSPFMVDPSRFDRVRIVQDKSIDADSPLPGDQEGTKVTVDVLDASGDSLFPLQGALGYDIAQTLFVGPNCLVVEGVSDLLYLQVFGALLEGQGRLGLDPRWTITPVGGADKVPTFVALLGSQKMMNIATLIDFQEKDRQTIENLWRRKLIEKKSVLTYASFVSAEEADVEDLLTPGYFLSLVNAEFAGELAQPILVKDLESKHPRIVVRLEEHLAKTPLRGRARFNHYRPARYLAEAIGKTPPPSEILDRFEAVFKAVNSLLE